MAEKKITDVSSTALLTDSDAIFVNQDDTLKQISKSDLLPLPENKILWSGGYYMNDGHIATLSESVSAQEHGIVLAWSAYSSGTSQDYNWNYFFIPKCHVLNHEGAGVECICGVGAYLISKYVYVHDTKITGNARNINGTFAFQGMSLDNSKCVLRYVIGV